MSRQLGADVTINFIDEDPVAAILEVDTGPWRRCRDRSAGTQITFENCLRVLRPGGVLSSLGVYSGKITLPVETFASGLGDHIIVSTLCPGGKEQMRRLMASSSQGEQTCNRLSHTVSLSIRSNRLMSCLPTSARRRY